VNFYELKISGVANVNRIIPASGSWNYKFLGDGNITLCANLSKPFSFDYERFERKVIDAGGTLLSDKPDNFTINSLIKTKKSKKMSETKSSSKVLTSSYQIKDTDDFKEKLKHSLIKGSDWGNKAVQEKLAELCKEGKTDDSIEASYEAQSGDQVEIEYDEKEKVTSLTISNSIGLALTVVFVESGATTDVKTTTKHTKQYPLDDQSTTLSTDDLKNALSSFPEGKEFWGGRKTITEIL